MTTIDKRIHEQGLVSVLKVIHENLDRAVLEAYGWEDLIPALGTDEFEPRILERLVALNVQRATEEEQGIVRWLRPEYQNPEGSENDGQQSKMELQSDEKVTKESAKSPTKRSLPSSLAEQITAVREALAEFDRPVTADEVVAVFKGRGKKKEERVIDLLDTLVTFGQVREADESRFVVS